MFAGTPKYEYKDGKGTDAAFYNPTGMTVDTRTGDLYVTENSKTIRKVTPEGFFDCDSCHFINFVN